MDSKKSETMGTKRFAQCLEDVACAAAAMKENEGATRKHRRLNSMERRRYAVRQYYEMTLTQAGDLLSALDFGKVFEEFNELKELKQLTDVEALAELQKKMQRQCTSAMTRRVCNLISNLWDEYTGDQEGYLSVAEGANLLADCIDWYQKHQDFYWDKTWHACTEQGVEHTKVFAKIHLTSLLKKQDPNISDKDLQAAIKAALPSDSMIRLGLRRDVAGLKAKCPEIMARSIEGRINNMENTTKVFMADMDKNGDEKVDKDEFLEHFMTAMSNTFGADKICERLTQEAMQL